MPRRIITCSECGRERPHSGGGLCGTCYARRYRALHTEETKEYARQYSIAYAEKHVENSRRYRALHAEKVTEYNRQYRAANSKKRNANSRQYSAANPERMRIIRQRRRARFHALPATLTAEQWSAILAAFGHKCAYCGRGNVKLTQDHVQPVSKGGAYEIGNIIPSCGPCNSAKGTKPPPRPVQTMLL